MQRIIEEIKDLKDEPTHRSALKIYAILENNRKKLVEKIEPSLYELMLGNFEELANSHPTRYFSSDFKDEYIRHYNMLFYNLGRVV